MHRPRLDAFSGRLATPRTRRGVLGALATLGLSPTALPAASKKKKPCLPSTSPLQPAVNATPPGGTIRLCVGVFPLAQTLDLPNDVTITGAGATGSGTTLALNDGVQGSVVSVGAGATVTLRGVAITGATWNGGVATGGGIANLGTLTLDRCALRRNFARAGGGVYNGPGARLTLIGTIVAGNTCTNGGGGGVYNEGTLIVRDGSVIGGTSAGEANVAFNGGGLVNFGSGTATFAKGTRVTGNEIDCGGAGQCGGGGIYNGVPNGVTLATTSIVTNNELGNCSGPQPVANCVE